MNTVIDKCCNITKKKKWSSKTCALVSIYNHRNITLNHLNILAYP